ncbi:MAG: DNA-directed RNA polymerase subunit H [Nanoarchaeota archaeon]|nr:DNA-directed RNA polymerase subunit H [Nanoarchaeota archaeon]
MADNGESNIQNHMLVPKHIKLSEEQAAIILKKYNVSKKQLPKIKQKDPALTGLDAVHGDIIEIIRNTPTVGKSSYYRVVV